MTCNVENYVLRNKKGELGESVCETSSLSSESLVSLNVFRKTLFYALVTKLDGMMQFGMNCPVVEPYCLLFNVVSQPIHVPMILVVALLLQLQHILIPCTIYMIKEGCE